MRVSVAILVAVTLGLFLWLVGCSSPGGGGATLPTPTPTAPPVAGRTSSPSLSAREIKVTLKDRTFPKEIRVKVGEKVVFVVTNEGTVMHTFEFPDFDEMRYNEIEGGQTMRIEWVAPNEKGKWDMGCYLTEEGYHEGMEGTLIIE